MAISFSSVRKPVNPQVIDPQTGVMREEWVLYFQQLTTRLNGAVGELGVDYVQGPASSTANNLAAFDGTTGKLIKDAGISISNVLTEAEAAAAYQPLDTDLTALAALASNGLIARTGSATYSLRTLTAPAAGITVSNGDGVSGNPTLALADDLAALEAMSSAGLVTRTASNTYSQRTITAGNSSIEVTNGDGVSGNPTLQTGIQRRSINDITSGDTITTDDRGKRVRILSGNGTLAFQPLATLGNGFWCFIHNAGNGEVTLDPDGAETIDGLTTWKLYPGGVILVQVTASDITSFLVAPMEVTYNASGTFTKPGAGKWVEVECWGAGGSGGRGAASVAGGGGGGGAYVTMKFPIASVGTTETVTIGDGGAARTTNTAGQTGGSTTFGTLVTAYGGIGGQVGAGGAGGGGGGVLSAGTTSTGGHPNISTTAGVFNSGGGGGNGNTSGGLGGFSTFGGGGGGGGDAATGGQGGTSLYGGGGGGGGGDTTAGGAAGTSVFGGAGGAGATDTATASNGTQPGGGGGGSETGNSGAGGNGRCRVRVY